MEFIKTEKAKNTIKYIFKRDDDLITEFTFIKHENKVSICVPSHTMCDLACKFCHTTKHIAYIPMKPVKTAEVMVAIDYIVNDLELAEDYNRLLISWMGTGEPMLLKSLVESMVTLKEKYKFFVKFSIATMLPKHGMVNFVKFTRKVKELKLPVKVHFSLHYVEDAPRFKMMPASQSIESSLALCRLYTDQTKQPLEIHYTLVKGKNDTQFHISTLASLLKETDFNVKFLAYNKNDMLDDVATKKKQIVEILKHASDLGLMVEYYESPGIEIGASCGSFKIEQYKSHQKLKSIPINKI